MIPAEIILEFLKLKKFIQHIQQFFLVHSIFVIDKLKLMLFLVV